MEPGLTTHVLDTAQGRPASSMQIELWKLPLTGGRTFVKTVCTNEDGRVGSPLLAGNEMHVGQYELVFFVGEYFAQTELVLTDPPFLDLVPVRFSIAEPGGHYHVPLLVSPWSYSTYKGS